MTLRHQGRSIDRVEARANRGMQVRVGEHGLSRKTAKNGIGTSTEIRASQALKVRLSSSACSSVMAPSILTPTTSAGSQTIEHIKALAAAGRGLNAFINTNAKKSSARNCSPPCATARHSSRAARGARRIRGEQGARSHQDHCGRRRDPRARPDAASPRQGTSVSESVFTMIRIGVQYQQNACSR